MSDAGPALQTAIYGALKAALEDSSPSICSVHDFAPEDEEYPYVTIGESTAVDDGDKTKPGQEHTVTIHAWDQTTGDRAGRKRAKEILAAVYDALHEQPLSITGFTAVSCRFDFASNVDYAADGRTLHGVHRYRIRTEPSS